ncbi:MAG: magnesium/cobalt transporter CorA [Inquilinus limosus]|uniref:Magnesium transport protein CorA n=1 Tax=Inquilinus limosus TaxID=171674 RepID=A0A952FKR8_9PROT|nr:magnesium/cobalt transporter CorA [Inquilinus limosus]
MGRVIAAAAYAEGRRVADIDLSEGRAWAEKPGHFVWIGIRKPKEPELRDLAQQFGLHPLAVEDALNAHQRPKLETYGDGLFVVLRTAHREMEATEFGETHIFVGPGYVVSVRHGPSSSYATVRERAEASPALLKHGEDFVLYSILDFVVDNYTPVVDAIEVEVTALEQRVLKAPLTAADIERIHALRRELLVIRRTVTPTAEVCKQLEHTESECIDEAMHPYFRDVADHVKRVSDDIDALREIVTHTFEAGLLLEASRQNQVQRKFAGWAAILAVPTAIAGIYGMNFDNMPELRLPYGYFVVLGVIAGLCGFLYWRFKRWGWL